MIESVRPDATQEGWNSWPTEQVSHTLRDDPSWLELLRSYAEKLADKSVDAACVAMALRVRDLTEGIVKTGEARELRESLLRFALSRVDWFQLAQSHIADVRPREPIDTISWKY